MNYLKTAHTLKGCVFKDCKMCVASEQGVSDMAPIDDLNHRDFFWVNTEMKGSDLEFEPVCS